LTSSDRRGSSTASQTLDGLSQTASPPTPPASCSVSPLRKRRKQRVVEALDASPHRARPIGPRFQAAIPEMTLVGERSGLGPSLAGDDAYGHLDRADELLFAPALGGVQVELELAERLLLDREAPLRARDRVAFAAALLDEPGGELEFGRLSRRVAAATGAKAKPRHLVRYDFGDFARACRETSAFVELVEVRGAELTIEFRLASAAADAGASWGDNEVLDSGRAWLSVRDAPPTAVARGAQGAHASSSPVGALVLVDTSLPPGAPGREVFRCPLVGSRTYVGLQRVHLGGLARQPGRELVVGLEVGGRCLTSSLGRLVDGKTGRWAVTHDLP
jgi:hypothetical protein